MRRRRRILDRMQYLPREVRDEIRFYLEMRAQELEESGLSHEEAWKAALAAFGDPERLGDEVLRVAERNRRRAAAGEWLRSVATDVARGLRGLVRDPGFAAVAIGTLALAIGASSAIFSVGRAALLRLPPVQEPGGLVAVYTTSRRGAPRSSSSYPDYADYRDRTAALSDLAATSLRSVSLGDESRGSRVITAQDVTGNYFSVLGLQPAAGRLLRSD